MMNIKTILAKAIEHGASDVHINVGMPPVLRKNTELMDMSFPAVGVDDAKEMLLSMVGPQRFEKFRAQMDLDFSTTIDDGHRFRVNAHVQRDTIAISFRVIPNKVFDLDELHLPPILHDLIDLPRGLVLVTGHTGSGKSTTLASMIGAINKKYGKRIVTLEDPIEYLLENDLSRALRPASSTFCVRTRTSLWSAKCETSRRRVSRSPRPRRATLSSARCTQSTPPRRSSVLLISTRRVSRTRSGPCSPVRCRR